jgi:hypothetical protein
MPNIRQICWGTAVLVVCVAQSFAQAPQPDLIAGLIESSQTSDQPSLPDAPSGMVAGVPMSAPSGSEEDDTKNSNRSIPDTFIPSASHSTYLQLNNRDRLRLFFQHSCSPSAFAGTILDASRAQFHNDWPGYGHGFQGFARRYGALLADRSVSSFFGTFLLPSLLHQESRYFRMGPQSSIWRRMGYALTRVGIARDADGKDTFNSSLLLSTILSNSLANTYYPKQQRGLSETIRRTEISLVDHVQSNLSREFLPDIQHRLWKHLPARLKQIERRMPFSRKWELEGFSETPPPAGK